MKAKNLIKILMLIIFLIACMCTTSYASTSPTLLSEAGVLIDSNTGKVLYGKNENKKMYPASTTKILTAIIALEKCNLSDKVTASYNAVMSVPSGYSNAEIQTNDVISVEDLLNVFLIHSANEAGFILAEYISGDVDSFATLMNEKAKEIGCKNTHFTNPSGIHDENHYSTAYDMALIAQYCMKNETFRKIVSTSSYTFSPSEGKTLKFPNTNNLILSSSKYYYKYAIGIKTGYTTQAKNCLISASTKDGLELISVVLGAQQKDDGQSVRYIDTINLFNYGFSNYKIKELIAKDTIVKEVIVKNATKDTENLQIVTKDTLTELLPSSTNINTSNYSIELNENLSAPITEGSVLGKLTYDINGETYSTDLIAKNSVIRSDVITLVAQIFLSILFLFILSKLLSGKNKKRKSKKWF